MYKLLNVRKEIETVDYPEEILEMKQLIDGRFAILSGSITENKLLIFNNNNFDLNNKKAILHIDEFLSPITCINQSTDESLLVLTLDGIITIIKFLPKNKYSIIQKLNAISNTNINDIIENNKLSDENESENISDNNNKINSITNNNENEIKKDEKYLNYKKLNSKISTMIDFNSCIIIELSNSLLFSIYDKTLKFYQANIIHNLYDQVKSLELIDVFSEPVEIDNSTLTILSWNSQSIHFYNIDTQLLLKRLDQINAYISVKLSEEYFCAIGSKYIYLISIQDQDLRNVFIIPGGYEIRKAITSPKGTLICSSQCVNSCDLVEFDITFDSFNEVSKIPNAHKNNETVDGVKVGSSLINALLVNKDNVVISAGSDKKIKFWN